MTVVIGSSLTLASEVCKERHFEASWKWPLWLMRTSVQIDK